MAVPRSNRAVLLAAVVFVTIFLGLAHFHLNSPSESTPSAKSGVDEPAPFVPEKEAAAAAPTFVPGEDEEIGATPAVEVVAETPKPEEHHHAVTPDKPEADPAEEPSDPEEIAEAEELAANASPTPAAASPPLSRSKSRSRSTNMSTSMSMKKSSSPKPKSKKHLKLPPLPKRPPVLTSMPSPLSNGSSPP
uniref:Uncharacterized protein n=1 Tax=Fusarium oxysporum (strain Fo5176) TaxID=660025 RepID=A0A0D2Y151_FUSOF